MRGEAGGDTGVRGAREKVVPVLREVGGSEVGDAAARVGELVAPGSSRARVVDLLGVARNQQCCALEGRRGGGEEREGGMEVGEGSKRFWAVMTRAAVGMSQAGWLLPRVVNGSLRKGRASLVLMMDAIDFMPSLIRVSLS